MTVMFVQMPREDVISYLGPAWPAKPGATVERVAFLSETAHGAVSVQEGSRPGITWFAVDGVLIPQDAGPLPQLEGDEMRVIPDEQPEEPPIDYDTATTADTATT